MGVVDVPGLALAELAGRYLGVSDHVGAVGAAGLLPFVAIGLGAKAPALAMSGQVS